ncbi:serine hydrolase domain-containing protein [Ilumatobacter nonamiensis]|uniref:serine hydrolase domain-containing protein n=1 Tax=Ilumatobacter nonamiensis TaxID=467093 RepID=UPI0003476668|nr:serine hydrolase domain-containing protein [Ilumatobacter nonamiensis]
MVEINGTVAQGFGAVADAFQQNFEEFPELGAGFALVADGELKVDITAGVADKATGRAFDEQTLQLVFSTTKGAAAICVARLVDAGVLSYDDTVASHWPEFGAAGKENVTVAQMLSHQAGLPYVDQVLSMDALLAVGPIVDALAAQTPLWKPGSTHGYHAVTYGWLAGELVLRVDGRSIGTYFAEEVAGPLGLDFWIGLPESEEPRVSTLEQAPAPTDPEQLALMMQVMGPGTAGFNALTMSGALIALGAGTNPFNTRAVHATEMPAANGITNASSLAKMYAATVGEVDGVRLVSPEVIAAASAEAVNGPDQCLVAETRFGMGFMLPNDMVPMLGPNAFGHAGAGGSLGQADPDTGVGYGYVMNQMLGGIAGDPRTVRLNDAVRTCL